MCSCATSHSSPLSRSQPGALATRSSSTQRSSGWPWWTGGFEKMKSNRLGLAGSPSVAPSRSSPRSARVSPSRMLSASGTFRRAASSATASASKSTSGAPGPNCSRRPAASTPLPHPKSRHLGRSLRHGAGASSAPPLTSCARWSFTVASRYRVMSSTSPPAKRPGRVPQGRGPAPRSRVFSASQAPSGWRAAPSPARAAETTRTVPRSSMAPLSWKSPGKKWVAWSTPSRTSP
mmetsp:Transcript_75342/g.212988  ORF Transcript_75342/g.212988 Transcript_75342/m.212988 type:complete len:234 (-) Transcript_75342:409-1110(-)